MIRKIIRIDESKCNGCGACAEACHEGAIGMVNGKAKLLRDDYCDGLGDCLPTCPTSIALFFVYLNNFPNHVCFILSLAFLDLVYYNMK